MRRAAYRLLYFRACCSIAIAALLLSACVWPGVMDAEPADREIAAAIQARYEAELFTLGLSRQRHYTQRLYRITGQQRYVPINVAYAARLALTLRQDIQGLERFGYPLQRGREIVENYSERTEKQRRRKAMLGDWADIAFARNLLFRLDMAHGYGVLGTPAFDGHKRALAYLESVDFRSFLTDPGVIEVYAAQVANMAYSLYWLGITDLRDEVLEAFRRHYPPERDARLSQAAFRNKVYGLTHFVIAASDYYQRPVSEAEYGWVLDYFSANIERILEKTKADIYLEVGLSFQLMGRTTHPVLTRVRQALRQEYDPQARMIPAEDGSTDFSTGEHRNVLAIMLLRWPERLHPGPDLSAIRAFSFHQLQGLAKARMLAVAQPFEHHHLAGHHGGAGVPRPLHGRGLVRGDAGADGIGDQTHAIAMPQQAEHGLQDADMRLAANDDRFVALGLELIQ